MTFTENDIPDLKDKIIIVTGNYLGQLLVMTVFELTYQAEIVVLASKRSPYWHLKEPKYILQLAQMPNTERPLRRFMRHILTLPEAKSNFSN
jgi:hypothetical protein